MPTVTREIIEVEVKGADDIAKQFSIGTSKASKNLVRDMGKVSDLVYKTFRKAPDEILKSQGMKDFVKRIQEVQKGHVKAAEIVAKLENESLDKRQKQELQAQLKREQKAIQLQQDLLKEESQALTKWGQRRKAIAEEAARIHTRTLADGIENAFNRIQSGDLKGLTDAISQGLAKAGGATRKLGGKAAAPGASKAMKAMGAAAKGLGLAVGALAAVAAATAAVVAIFVGLDEKVKDFNKGLIESQGAVGLTFKTGAEGAAEMADTLELVRKAAFDTSNNLKWMTMPKEQMDILKAFGEANFQIKEMTQGLTDASDKMSRLQDVTSVALTYSKLLGVSAEDVAQGMGDIMHQTGLGLDRVQEGFSKVARVAQESGFNVKRFYSTVLEVTSGMGYYNIRIEEAAHLLDKFTKMLGKGPGTEFFKSIKEGFAEMSYKERVKQIMVTGGKEVRKILAAESDKAAERFWTDFGENKEVKKALKEVGDEFGLSVKGGKDLAQSLAKLSEKEYTKLVTELRHGHGLQGEITNELERLRALQRGASGKLGDQAKALDDMSETGALAMKMTSFMGKSLHEYSLTQLMAFEDMKGISGDQLKTLQNMSREFHGAWGTMQEMAKDAEKYGISQDTHLDDMTKKQKSLLDFYGAAVDEQGKIRKATVDQKSGTVKLGDEINNLQEFIVKQNQVAEAAKNMQKDMLTKDQQFAQQIVQNTEPLSKILDISIQGWLMKIYDVMRPVSEILLEIAEYLVPEEYIKPVKDMIEGQKKQTEMLRDAGVAITKSKEGLDKLSKQRESVEEALAKTRALPESHDRNLQIQGLERQLKDIDEKTASMKATLQVARKTREIAGSERSEAFVEGGVRGEDVRMKLGKAKSKIRASLGAEELDTKDIPKVLESTDENIDTLLSITKELSPKDDVEKLVKDQDKEAKKKKTRDETLQKSIDKMPDETAKANAREERKLYEQDILTGLGYSEQSVAGMDASKRRRTVEAALHSEKFSGLDLGTKQYLVETARLAGIKAPKVGGASGAEVETPSDFILTDAGRLIQPTAEDQIMGLKPGGPLAKALAGAKGKAQVNVTIYESHNTEKTYATVKRALRDSGLTN